MIKENAHPAIVDRALFDRIQEKLRTKITTIGRTFHRPYLLTGIARCANCGYRMIGQPSNGNGHRYLTYTCSGYLRIGKSVCRSVHVLTEALEQEVISSIREHLSSPEWKNEVRDTLRTMVAEEFGDSAATRAHELTHQLAEVNRQIAGIVDAIKTSARFSEALNKALADLETQRDSIRTTLGEAEKRVNQQVGAEMLAEKIMDKFGDFDRIWKEGLNVEEQKELLRCYVHQVNISHSPTAINAEIWLYKIPLPKTQMTPALNGLQPLITRVNCGGLHLTLVKVIPSDILALLVGRRVELKPPRSHYRVSTA